MRPFNFSYFIALIFLLSLGYWMTQGEVVVGGTGDKPLTSDKKKADKNEEANTLFKVRVEKFSAQSRQPYLEIRGRTEAEANVTVRAETRGRVIKRFISQGDTVKKGDVLCELDMGTRKAKLLQARARLEQTKFDLNANNKLKKSGYASQSRVASLRYAKDSALAALEEIELDIANTKVSAPIDGLIQPPLAEVGDHLNAGGNCANILDLNPILMVGYVSEQEITQLEVGMKAQIFFVDKSSSNGIVRYVGRSADSRTRTFKIEISIPNEDKKIRDGVTARAAVILPKMKAHLLSPVVLTLSDDGLLGVRAVNDKGQVQFLPVNVLQDSKEGIWLSGLMENVTIITVGQEFVKSGQYVEPVFASQGE